MNKLALIAALCSLTIAACKESGPPVKAPRFSDARATMAKIGGKPLPVFEFSTKVESNDNKIVGQRAFVSTTAPLYKRSENGYELVEAKKLDAEYVSNVTQVRATVDPAKEEALATHLNGEGATVAFRFEVDWTAPGTTEVQTLRSIVFETDNETISTAGLAKEIKE